MFDGTEALLPNPYEEENDEIEERAAPFESITEHHSERSVSEEAVNSLSGDDENNGNQK